MASRVKCEIIQKTRYDLRTSLVPWWDCIPGPWVRDVRESTIAFARRPGKLDVSLGAFGVLQEAIMTARSFRS